MENFSEILSQAFSDNNLSHLLDTKKAQKLQLYAEHLAKKAKVMNLTAITDAHGIAYKHFADCATVADHITQNASVIDIGCGAGLPSVVLAILRPDITITALDSTAKKIDFIRETCRLIDITNLTAISSRAEEYVVNNREKYDFAVSRAVSALNILSEISLPYVKRNGHLLAMKGAKAEAEINDAVSAIQKLGGSITDQVSFILLTPTEKCERSIVKILKISATPTQFPRKYAQILKKPL